MTGNTLSEADLGKLVADVQSLKREIAALAEDSRNTVWSGAAETATALGTEAQRLYEGVAAKSRDQVKRVSDQVQGQPIMSILIAFGVGFLGGRILR